VAGSCSWVPSGKAGRRFNNGQQPALVSARIVRAGAKVERSFAPSAGWRVSVRSLVGYVFSARRGEGRLIRLVWRSTVIASNPDTSSPINQFVQSAEVMRTVSATWLVVERCNQPVGEAQCFTNLHESASRAGRSCRRGTDFAWNGFCKHMCHWVDQCCVKKEHERT
jgi:hypothetical protein